MSEDSQIVVPRSFIDLFVPKGAIKPTASREEISERYELCEDLAQALTEQARHTLFELGIAESDVLERIQAGLAGGEVVSEPEARWVVRRLAELLDWEPLAYGPER